MSTPHCQPRLCDWQPGCAVKYYGTRAESHSLSHSWSCSVSCLLLQSVHLCSLSHSFAFSVPFVCVLCPICLCSLSHSFAFSVPFVCVFCPIHSCSCSWAIRGSLSGDDLFSAPKLSQSSANSDLGHLRHSLDSDHLQVPETLQSTSYSKPLPAVPNATAHSFHSNLSPNTPSEGCSETSTSSKSNPDTSLDSTPSNPNSTPTFFGDSLSHNRVRATPVASDIKGQVIKAICDVKGWWWSGSMGNAGWWPWL